MNLENIRNEVIELYPGIEIELIDSNKVSWKLFEGCEGEIHIENEHDYKNFKDMIKMANNLKGNSETLVCFEHNEIRVVSDAWTNELDLELETFNNLNEAYEFIERFIELVKYIKSKNEKIEIKINDDVEMMLENESWKRELYFKLTDLKKVKTIMKAFFEYRYEENEYCFTDNYIEFPITLAHDFTYYNSLDGRESLPNFIGESGITFEISTISEFFWSNVFKGQSSDGEDFYEETTITTLKIYNINNFLGIDVNDSDFVDKCFMIVDNILFYLSHKYSLELQITDLPDFDDDGSFHLDEWDEEISKIDLIEENRLDQLYDSDLINYYIRAMNMAESQFKYLAFYQIIECIFDEVYLHETVQDVKQIINSDWFSKNNDDHITEVINLVEQYNKSKSDREKIRLVLERYFKGSVHDEAYLKANKGIIELLLQMNKISKATDLKDLQKIGTIIYDFRCECTHSNRKFSFRATFDGSNEELSNYIKLIKKVSERIILNYQSLK